MNPYENLYIALVKEAMEGVNTDRPFSFTDTPRMGGVEAAKLKAKMKIKNMFGRYDSQKEQESKVIKKQQDDQKYKESIGKIKSRIARNASGKAYLIPEKKPTQAPSPSSKAAPPPPRKPALPKLVKVPKIVPYPGKKPAATPPPPPSQAAPPPRQAASPSASGWDAVRETLKRQKLNKK